MLSYKVSQMNSVAMSCFTKSKRADTVFSQVFAKL